MMPSTRDPPTRPIPLEARQRRTVELIKKRQWALAWADLETPGKKDGDNLDVHAPDGLTVMKALCDAGFDLRIHSEWTPKRRKLFFQIAGWAWARTPEDHHALMVDELFSSSPPTAELWLHVEKWADFKVNTPIGDNSFLLCASFFGRSELVKTLIEQGANVHWKNPLGENCLHLALSGGAWALEGATDQRKVLMQERVDCINALMENGARLDERNYFGETPLEKSQRLIPSRLKDQWGTMADGVYEKSQASQLNLSLAKVGAVQKKPRL